MANRVSTLAPRAALGLAAAGLAAAALNRWLRPRRDALPSVAGATEGALQEVHRALVICAPTFFKSTAEPRFAASLATLAACRARGFAVVLVDGSPSETGVPEALRAAGAHVAREEGRGKGNALRQALRVAKEEFPAVQVFAFQELEKTDFVRFYEAVVPGLLQSGVGGDGRWDFCNPARSEASWATYPTEQVLEERFQNQLGNLLARANSFQRDLDWSFGPFLLRSEHVRAWIEYPGQTYDSQWGPMIDVFRKDPSVRVGTPTVDYMHSQDMRAEEEGSLDHAKRRLKQLNDVAAALESAWTQ